MKITDALFNWLQMMVVSNARPNDWAATETLEFFAQVLLEDHQLTDVEMHLSDEETYEIRYVFEGQPKTHAFDRLRVDQLLDDINSTPKYNIAEVSEEDVSDN